MKYNKIEKLLQNKMGKLEVSLPAEVWGTIEAKLKRKRFLRFFWFFLGSGIISSIALMIIFSSSISTTYKKEIKKNEVKILNEITLDSDENKYEVLNLIPDKKISARKTTNKRSFKYKKSTVNVNNQKLIKDIMIDIRSKKINALVDDLDSLTNNLTKEIQKKEKAVKIAGKAVKKDTLLKFKKDKWSITPAFGVLYSGRFTKNISVIDSRFDENPSSGLTSVSYGYKVAYKISDKISFQSGVIFKEVRFITKQLFLTDITAVNNLFKIDYNSDVLVRFSNSNLNLSGEPEAENTSLVQTIGYIEIPVEVKYKIYNTSKFNSNFIGGLSYLYLSKNEISAKTSLSSRKIAKANNLLSSNVSFNIGLDIDYNLSKRLFLNMNIMFKRHYKTYIRLNSKSDPFVTGIFTGVGYRF